jgi:hypothetical protein
MRRIIHSPRFFALVFLAWLLVEQPASAWFDFGHMVVASAAYSRLTDSTRRRVDELMKLNPEYPSWNQRIGASASQPQHDMMIFMLAATWADAIKHDSSYIADGSEAGNKPDSPSCADNIGYTDKKMHKYWHFCDRRFSTDGTALPPQAVPNAQTEIDTFRAALSSPDVSDPLKSYDLTWIIHLVGDVHQPLHCAARVSIDDPGGDKGGNDVKVVSLGGPTSLHGFFDGCLGADEDLLKAVAFAGSLPEPKRRDAGISTTATWIAEGLKLARRQAYRTPVKAGLGPFKLTAGYERAAKTLCRQRAALAAARLANLLENELK